MNPLIQLKTTSAILVALACVALSPIVRAVSPPPDGGYPGENTAEGTDALKRLTSGGSNTAVGFNALFNDTTGQLNTAMGWRALLINNGSQNTATGINALAANSQSQRHPRESSSTEKIYERS
jgi:hypothetical protein